MEEIILVSSDSSESSVTEFIVYNRPVKYLDCIYKDALKIYKIQLDNMNIYCRDLMRLRPNRWLNDRIINAYMRLIQNRMSNVYCFSTYAYPSMIGKSINNIKKWFSESDILSYEYVIIPIHQVSHWTLIIVNEDRIEYYDSLHGFSPLPCITIKKLFEGFTEDKFGTKRQYRFKNRSLNIDRQTNGDDCGVFCCMNAKYRVIPNLKVWFSESEIRQLRKQMLHEIISGHIIYDK